jgi:ABC-type transport system involved in Fe-S cluster assembly fused permease/ATPase subunit
MRRTTLLIDLALAAVVAAIVLIVSSGLAIAAIIALIVLVVCGISLLVGRWRGRMRRRRRSGPAGSRGRR